MKKSKSKQPKKKVAVRKTKKKKSIRKAQAKPISDVVEEDDEIAEAKIKRSMTQEDDFLDRQIDNGDEDDEDEDPIDGGFIGEDF